MPKPVSIPVLFFFSDSAPVSPSNLFLVSRPDPVYISLVEPVSVHLSIPEFQFQFVSSVSLPKSVFISSLSEYVSLGSLPLSVSLYFQPVVTTLASLGRCRIVSQEGAAFRNKALFILRIPVRLF